MNVAFCYSKSRFQISIELEEVDFNHMFGFPAKNVKYDSSV